MLPVIATVTLSVKHWGHSRLEMHCWIWPTCASVHCWFSWPTSYACICVCSSSLTREALTGLSPSPLSVTVTRVSAAIMLTLMLLTTPLVEAAAASVFTLRSACLCSRAIRNCSNRRLLQPFLRLSFIISHATDGNSRKYDSRQNSLNTIGFQMDGVSFGQWHDRLAATWFH